MSKIIVKAGRFRGQTVFAPLDCLHPLDIHESADFLLRIALPSLEPFIIYTRNPYVLDEFPAEQCFIVGQSGNEKRLLDHPQSRLLGELSTGEFWSSIGEEWVDK